MVAKIRQRSHAISKKDISFVSIILDKMQRQIGQKLEKLPAKKQKYFSKNFNSGLPENSSNKQFYKDLNSLGNQNPNDKESVLPYRNPITYKKCIIKWPGHLFSNPQNRVSIIGTFSCSPGTFIQN